MDDSVGKASAAAAAGNSHRHLEEQPPTPGSSLTPIVEALTPEITPEMSLEARGRPLEVADLARAN